MNGGVSSKELNKKLLNILDQLKSNSNLLDDSDFIKRIKRRLKAGADPNVQNQDGKTLLHYVAERNNTNGIGFLLKAGADPNMQDHSGKTPLHYAAENNCLQAFEYVTERECRQAIKDLGYDLDDSHENEGNPTTPDGSVDDCSNSSGDDSQIESVKLSDCNTEEDSNCSSSDNLCNDDKNDNEKDDKETVTKLILEEIEGVLRCTVPECDGMIKYEKTIPSKEELWLHGRAKTTETIRRAIQNSKESIAKLSKSYNLKPKTIIKWRKRSFTKDAGMGPKHPRSTVLTLEEECCIS